MKEIVKGVYNHHVKGETELSKQRMDICKQCPSKVEDEFLGLRCGECGCILKYKVKSDSGCPLKKW